METLDDSLLINIDAVEKQFHEAADSGFKELTHFRDNLREKRQNLEATYLKLIKCMENDEKITDMRKHADWYVDAVDSDDEKIKEFKDCVDKLAAIEQQSEEKLNDLGDVKFLKQADLPTTLM